MSIGVTSRRDPRSEFESSLVMPPLEPGKERSPLWETNAALGFLGALYLFILLLMRFHAKAWVF
jgi:hypothetical protein